MCDDEKCQYQKGVSSRQRVSDIETVGSIGCLYINKREGKGGLLEHRHTVSKSMARFVVFLVSDC